MNGHQIALWAGVSAFFANVVGLGLVDVLKADDWIRFGGALVTSLFVAGAVYAKQRLDDARGIKPDTSKPPLP